MSEEFQLALDVLDAGSGIGLLVLAVILFYRGDIITKRVFDKIIKTYEERIDKFVRFYEKQYEILLKQNEGLFNHIQDLLNKKK